MPYRPVPNYRYSSSRVASPLPVVGQSFSMTLIRRGLLILALIPVVIVVYHTVGAAHKKSTVNAAASKSSVALKPTLPAVTPNKLSQMQSAINAIIAQYPTMDMSVSTIDLENNQAQNMGESVAFTAGSTAKLLTAVTYLHGVEAGDYTLDQNVDGETAQDALQALIVNSDDTAWQNLNDLMTHDTLESYAADLGMTDYDPSVNTLPASDIATLLQKLYDHKILNASDTNLLLSYMQQANYRDYIVAAVPSGYTVYHKVGLVDDEVHDSSIITKDGRSIVLVIFTKGNGDDDLTTRAAIMHQITQAALAAYF